MVCFKSYKRYCNDYKKSFLIVSDPDDYYVIKDKIKVCWSSSSKKYLIIIIFSIRKNLFQTVKYIFNSNN